MKHKLLFTALFLCIAVSLQAQFVTGSKSGNSQVKSQSGATSYAREGFQKGDSRSIGNFYYSRMMDMEDLDLNFNLGFDLQSGVYLQDNLFVQGGLGWMHGGYRYEYDLRHSMNVTESMLYVPISIGYDIPTGENSALEVYTGPRLNYKIYGKVEENRNGTTHKTKYKDIDGIERFYMNWNIGAALTFNTWGIAVEYRPAFDDKFPDYISFGFIWK